MRTTTRRSLALLPTALLSLAVASDQALISPVQPLVRATRGVRLFEARLAGGFAWAPTSVVRGARSDAAPIDAEAIDAAARILDAKNASIESQRAKAVAYLALGMEKRAAAAADSIPPSLRSGAAWSDIAAFKYATAVETGDGHDLMDALVAADSAIRDGGPTAEARFNRALIIEQLGCRELASEAWREFLDVDSESGWAVEARAHISRLATPKPNFRDELQKRYDRIATDDSVAADLARTFPQEVRTWGETEVLGRWADAMQRGDVSAAARHLAVARAFGRIVAAHGDTLLAQAVSAIDRADPQRRERLVSAHLLFRKAQKTFMALKPSDAEPLFAHAANDFDRAGSPVALLARYFQANTQYEQGRIDEARAALETLLAGAPANFPSARAQIAWELGLCHWARNHFGDAIDSDERALKTFEQLGEAPYATAMRAMLATLYEAIGDDVTAWKYRYAAMRELGAENSTRLMSSLAAAANAAILRRDWSTAMSFLNLEITAARQTHSEVFLSDALLRRALVLQRSGLTAAGRDDLLEARSHTRRIADAGMRAQSEGRLLWVEGTLAATPQEAILWFTRAVAHNQTTGRRMFLPPVLLARARAYRAAGDPAAAMRDLDAAIDTSETDRQSLSRADQRWSFLNDRDDIFNEAVDLALSRGDVDQALRYADRGRARTLLDRRQIAPLQREITVPHGTAIIEYVTTPDHLLIFTADASGVRHSAVNATRESLKAEIQRLALAVHDRDRAGMQGLLRRLGEELIDPISHEIERNETLVFVPDGTLDAIPFAALIDAGQQYVIEAHPVVVSPSAAAFVASPPDSHLAARKPLIIVADDGHGSEPFLTHASPEAHAIARCYPAATILGGHQATPEQFERAAPGAEIIHFVGHALTSNRGPDETVLLLSNARGESAPLDVSRISAMRLDATRVVVLAACGTARGRVSRMEGTQSVARAFLAAGSKSVVATLWPIDDAAAERFFTTVHRHLSRAESPAEALRAAQIESIRESVSPSMWAAVEDIGR